LEQTTQTFKFLLAGVAAVSLLVGGVIGILLGSLGALVLSRLAHWNTLISPAAVLMAFCFSAAVDLVFGIWPARRAATLDPIEALRYE
jgi:putative ABC transport system permease protein